MNYKKFIDYIGYTDDGTRKYQNVAVRAAYVKAFRPFYKLEELGHHIGKNHATVIHYLKQEFPRDALFKAAYESAVSIRGEVPTPKMTVEEQNLVNVLNYDYLVEQNADLKREIAQLKATLSHIQELIKQEI